MSILRIDIMGINNGYHELVGGQILMGVHTSDICAGQYCTIHNFSDHHMVTWPQNWRPGFYHAYMERICPHGIGHPDPDEIYIEEIAVHACDGCCDPKSQRLNSKS